MEVARTPILHFTLRPDGIVLAESQPGVEPTAELLKQAEEACRIVRGNTKRPALWDIRNLERPRPDSWRQFLEVAPNNLEAIAVLGSEAHMRLLGAFPELINKMLIPFQMYTDETDAIDWLAPYV